MFVDPKTKWFLAFASIVAIAIVGLALRSNHGTRTHASESPGSEPMLESERDDGAELNALLRALHDAVRSDDEFALDDLFHTPESAKIAWGGISHQTGQVGRSGVLTATTPPTLHRIATELSVDELSLEAWYELGRPGSSPQPFHTTWRFLDTDAGWRLSFLGLDASRVDLHDMMEELTVLDRRERRRLRLGFSSSNEGLLISVLRAIEDRNTDELSRISLNGIPAAAKRSGVVLDHPRIRRKSVEGGLRAVDAQVERIWSASAALGESPTELARYLRVYRFENVPPECRQLTLSMTIIQGADTEFQPLRTKWSAGWIDQNWLLDTLEVEAASSGVARN